MATGAESGEPVGAGDDPPEGPGLHDPLFFVSHANVPGVGTAGDADDFFLDFFTELSGHVNQLHYRPPGADPGFLDLDMTGGLRWEREIFKAVGRCAVFVALVSSPYVNRDWCGFEWYAFRRRRCWNVELKTWTETNVCTIPVLWAPLTEDQTPPAVSDVELFRPPTVDVPALSRSYLRHGMHGLHSVRPDHYSAAVWYLAQGIKRALDKYRVEPRVPATRAELRNAFETRES
jgi:hypothetical protein